MITIRLPDAGQRSGPPDIVWDGFRGDFALVDGPDQGPDGGLKSGQQLATAVAMLLFTDARADATDLRFEHAGDRRGWVGDGFDIASGETELGSRLWLFRRHELIAETGRLIEDEALRALQPLIDQQAVVSIRAAAEVDAGAGRIALALDLFGRNGERVYHARFDDLWKALDALPSSHAR